MQTFKTYFENQNYWSGLSKSIVQKRRAQFNKQADMPDDDPDGYQQAPGDSRRETKTSKWTKAYASKYGGLDEEENVGLKNKSEKTGISYNILKQVYNRGMAAWKSGHRPGANQQQWAYARVNSFIMNGPARKSDKDLWAKHKEQKG